MSRYITTIADPIPQNTTPIARCQFVDDLGNPVPKANIVSCVMTLYSPSGGVINARDAVDVMSSVDTAGAFAFTLTTSDTALLDEANAREKRVLLLEWATNAASGKHEFHFYVANLGMVP